MCDIIYLGYFYFKVERRKDVKKYISLILCIFILFLSFSMPVYATEDSEDKTSSIPSDALTYTCVYDIESKRVRVSGTMNSELFRDYSDWSLCVFKLPFGKNASDIIADDSAKPIARTMASIKFEFSFKAEAVADRYSRYAILLCSPENEYLTTTEAQYPEVNANVPSDLAKNFKGFAGEFSSLSAEISPSTTILDIDLNTVFSDTSTGLFVFVDNKQCFFNESSIDALDVAVRSMSVSGSRIYFRFLYSNDVRGTTLPDVYDQQTLLKVHSLVVFLTQRYSQYNSGKMSGIILGKGVGASTGSLDIGEMTPEEYVDRCVSYLVLTANAARAIDSSIDIVFPLGADFFVADNEGFKAMTEAFLQKLDESFRAGINFSFLLECNDAPIASTLAEANPTTQRNSIQFDADAQKQFTQYVQSLEHKYRSMPKRYMLLWTPSTSLRGNLFAATYAYCYYSLLADNYVSVFAINVDKDTTQNNLRNIAHVVKYIDTYEGSEVAKNLPLVFGAKSWDELLGEGALSKAALRHCYSIEASVKPTKTFVGEFKYFDFTASGILEDWYAGVGCSLIKSNISADTNKSLKAEFDLGGIYEIGEILYVAKYAENMIYTPTLRFKVMVDNGEQPSLYEIGITVGNLENRIESYAIVSSGEISEIYVDISSYISSNMVDYVKITTRSLDGNESKCSLLVYDICGLSASYDSDTLDSLIMSERDKIRHSDELEEDKKYWTQISVGIGVLLLIGALGMSVFVGFRREDLSDKDKDKDKDRDKDKDKDKE